MKNCESFLFLVIKMGDIKRKEAIYILYIVKAYLYMITFIKNKFILGKEIKIKLYKNIT